MLPSVTEYYTVSQSITEYNRVLQSVTEWYRVIQSVTVCIAEYYRVFQSISEYYRVLQSITECYRVLQNITEYNRSLRNLIEFPHEQASCESGCVSRFTAFLTEPSQWRACKRSQWERNREKRSTMTCWIVGFALLGVLHALEEVAIWKKWIFLQNWL